jgi:hypothetical protein
MAFGLRYGYSDIGLGFAISSVYLLDRPCCMGAQRLLIINETWQT